MKHLLIINLFGELLILTICLLLGRNNINQIDVYIVSNLLWIAGTIASKNYYINRLPGAIINIINLTKWFILYYLILFLFTKLFHEFDYTNIQLLKFAGLLYTSLLVWRLIVFLLLKRILKTNKKDNVIIVGVSVNSIHFKDFIDKRPQYEMNILGFFTDKTIEKIKDPIHIIGDYAEITDYCLKNNVSEIICSVDKVDKDLLNSLIDFSENNFIDIRILPDTGGVYGRNFVTTFIEYIPLLVLRKNPFDELSNKLIKRLFDIVFSIMVIIFVLSWLFPIIAILILIDSKGPVLFTQERTGLLNESFYCLKFRTMKVNYTANTNQATKNDARVTKIGAFLRRTSLDELPQFLNVLIGDMSVVGPRPHMIKHTEEYSQLVDKYMLRHLVKPGITGLSQIMGYRGETQHDLYLMKMRVRMDRFYIENWSFYLDLKLVYSTMTSIFKKNEKVY